MDQRIISDTGKESYTNFNALQSIFKSEPQPPSAFELGVAEQLKALAELIIAGEEHITHFTLTVTNDSQRMEIVVD